MRDIVLGHKIHSNNQMLTINLYTCTVHTVYWRLSLKGVWDAAFSKNFTCTLLCSAIFLSIILINLSRSFTGQDYGFHYYEVP